MQKVWYEAEKGDVHSNVMQYVSTVESAQSSVYERFARLAFLYDPYDMAGYDVSWDKKGGPDSQVSENVVASNVDSVNAVIAVTDVRSRFMTDDGDWSAQRLAKHLEWYIEGLGKILDVADICRRAFKDCTLKGTGLVKVYIDPLLKKVCVERVMVDDIIVDEAECRAGGMPRQMHHRQFLSKTALIARYPEHEQEIRNAQSPSAGSNSGAWRFWDAYRPMDRDELVAIHSWLLPVGKKGQKGYVAGKETLVIDGCDLFDEVYDEDIFPISRVVWSERDKGWYGIGLGERIAGHQRELNKLNWQIDRVRDQRAVPTTYVRQGDANLMVKSTNRIGTIVAYKVEKPHTVIPQAVSDESYRRRTELIESSYEETGMARLAATGKKPAGLDSGIALREYRDQTTQRFAVQEKNWERFRLDVDYRILLCCKKLGASAPAITRQSRFGSKKIEWSEVDPKDLQVQIAAASTLSRTPAGRLQLVMEFAQQGIVSQDEARRLIQHPDLERAMSLYTASVEDIEACIEAIYDGEEIAPEPFQNLKMLVWRCDQEFLEVRHKNPPEDILEALREFTVNAAFIMSLAEQPTPQVGAPPMPMDAGMAGPSMPLGPPQLPIAPSIAPEAIGVATA